MAEWVNRWGYDLATKPSRPGIWRLKSGGFLVFVRVRDPRSKKGSRRTKTKALPRANLHEAQRWRDLALEELRADVAGRTTRPVRFSAFATSLFKAKVDAGDIKSAKGREKWGDVLELHILPVFGDSYCGDIRHADVDDWRNDLAAMVRAKEIAPSTANGWISVLRVITSAMTAKYELPRDPCAGIKNLDLSQAPTYTDEKPNALTAEWAAKFLAAFRAKYPQLYAMALLGFVTGKRPSTLRPLRRSGPESDVDWETGRVLFRRSNSLGQEVMVGTKTGRREAVHLPPEVMRVLRESVELIESPPLSKRGKGPLWWREEMKKSDLLFPSRTGGFRTRSVLDKPFAFIAKKIKLPFPLTPRAMRRTFNDLAREAGIHDVVTRSITGHATEAMQEHYSTARADEQRKAIGQVAKLVDQNERAES